MQTHGYDYREQVNMNASGNEPPVYTELREALGAATSFVVERGRSEYPDGGFPQIEFEIRYFEPDENDPTRSTGKTDTCRRDSFAAFFQEHRDSLNAAEAVENLNRTCSAFEDAHGVSMQKYWATQYGTRMLHRYFELAGEFSYDPSIANEAVEEFVADLTSATEQIELVYYVQHFSAERPFDLGNGMVSFHPVTRTDLEVHGRPLSDGWSI